MMITWCLHKLQNEQHPERNMAIAEIAANTIVCEFFFVIMFDKRFSSSLGLQHPQYGRAVECSGALAQFLTLPPKGVKRKKAREIPVDPAPYCIGSVSDHSKLNCGS